MTVALVQSRATNVSSGSFYTLAYSSAVTPGNVLIAGFIALNNTRTISSFVDTVFGTWTQAVISTSTNLATIYYLPNAVSASSTPTVQVTISGNSAAGLFITEWSGLAPIVDQTGINHGTSAFPSVSTASTTTSGNELVFANFSSSLGSTWTAGSGYTLLTSNSLQGVEYNIPANTGTQSATINLPGSQSFEATIATFIPLVPRIPILTRRYVQFNI